jgi:hypothetical protein
VTTEIGRRHGSDPSKFVAEMLKLADIFGTDLVGNDDVRTTLARFVGQLRAAPASEVVAAVMRAV